MGAVDFCYIITMGMGGGAKPESRKIIYHVVLGRPLRFHPKSTYEGHNHTPTKKPKLFIAEEIKVIKNRRRKRELESKKRIYERK